MYSESYEYDYENGIRSFIRENFEIIDGVKVRTEFYINKFRMSDDKIVYSHNEHKGYVTTEEFDYDADVRTWTKSITYYYGDTESVETTTRKYRISDGLDLYYKYEVNGVVRNTREWIFSDEGDIRTTVCVTTQYDNGEASYTQTNTSKMNIADGWIISEAYSDSNGSFWECEYLRYEGNNYTKLYRCVEYTEVRDHNFAEDTVTITKTHNDETGSVETWTERISTGEIIG